MQRRQPIVVARLGLYESVRAGLLHRGRHDEYVLLVSHCYIATLASRPDDALSRIGCYIPKLHGAWLVLCVDRRAVRFTLPQRRAIKLQRYIPCSIACAVKQDSGDIGPIGHTVPTGSLGRTADANSHGPPLFVHGYRSRVHLNGVDSRVCRVTRYGKPRHFCMKQTAAQQPAANKDFLHVTDSMRVSGRMESPARAEFMIQRLADDIFDRH